jgi:hypothetical protein
VTAFSCVINRSASDWPSSGLPWWSTKISRSLAPPSPGRPSVRANGRSRSWRVFTISAAVSAAALASTPACATGPLSG